jgi:hypothetical protein
MKKIINSFVPKALIAAVVVLSFGTSAFKPAFEDYGHTSITRKIVSEGGYSGANLGWPEIKQFNATLSTQGTMTFAAEAIEHLVQGVQSNDWVEGSVPGEPNENGETGPPRSIDGVAFRSVFKDPNAHCDDDLINGCRQFIVARRFNALAALEAAYAAEIASDLATARTKQIEARLYVGRLLHTLQDFYAHSNFSHVSSNFNNSDAYYAQLSTTNGRIPDTRSLEKPYCEGVNTFEVLGSIPATDMNGAPIYDAEGKLVYLFRNFTWEKNPGNWKLLETTDNSAYTTGYFDFYIQGAGLDASAPDAATRDVKGARCDHGNDLAAISISGIAKDAPNFPFAPAPNTDTTNLHYRASYHAATHTKKVLEHFIELIKERAGSDEEKADSMIELFMGQKPVTAFVIDVTGSMQDIMDGVRDELGVLLAQLQGTSSASDTNKRYLLTTYKETTTSPSTAEIKTYPIGNITNFVGAPVFSGGNNKYFGNLNQLYAGLRALPTATGGGDCPEPTMQALLETVKKLPRRSKVYIFTDASTKDREIVGSDQIRRKESEEIGRIAQRRGHEILFSLSGSCSPISPAYYQIAANSGGQVMLVDHTSSDVGVAIASVASGARSLSTIHVESNLLNPGATKGIVVPVESNASQLLFTVTNDSGGIAVRDPSGNLQNLTSFLGGAMLKVNNPAPGNWTVGLSGWPTTPPGAPASAYSVKVQALGAFDLSNVQYSAAQAQGRASHEINMPYGVNPPAADVRISAQLSTNAVNNPASHQWQAVAEDGTVLGSLNISRKTPDQYEGVAALQAISATATRPWRIRVSGVDNAGQPFARMLPTLQSAKRYTADVIQSPSHWVPGALHTIRVRVDNYGANDSFGFRAATTLGQISSVSPVAAVPNADYAIYEVKVQLPASVAANAAGLLTASLTSQAAGGAVLEAINIPYTVLQDTDTDGVPDIIEKGSNGIDDNYDGNADGTPDWKQAAVISMPSDARRAYLTAALTAGQFRFARTLPAEGLSQIKYTADLIDFKIIGLPSGGATQMKLYLPGYMTAAGYGKFGPVPGNFTPAWYDFNYDSATGLGATVDKNLITLHLKDGAKGDDDLLANGVIVDIGGPVGVQIANSAVAGTTTTQGTGTTTTPGTGTTTTPGTGTGTAGGSTNASGANPMASGGGGGGCTLGQPGHEDWGTLLLLIASILLLGRRRQQRLRHIKSVQRLQ